MTFSLFSAKSGAVLGGANNVLQLRPHADDSCVWIRRNVATAQTEGSLSFKCAVSDVTITVSQQEENRDSVITCISTDTEARSIAEFLEELGTGNEFRMHKGPTRLPSHHLAEIRETGLTVLDNILDLAALERLKTQAKLQRAKSHPREPPTDGDFKVWDSMVWSADVLRASTHPVAMWVLQEYLNTPAIHFCHQPCITTLKPAKELKGSHPSGGWHCDFPYHQGVLPVEDWTLSKSLGIQYNVCLDPFTPETGGTQYLPRSHLRCEWPDAEFRQVGNHMGHGVHRDVTQMTAAAGSALLYDSRMWHRACPELNISGKDRLAILHAVTPAHIHPKIDKASTATEYQNSDIATQLTKREQQDVVRLCSIPTTPPPQAPTVDTPETEVVDPQQFWISF
eukprot:m.51004 g.51004  ORF g.51004 m.51004 type:complete len:396 (-) comp21378_c0_seq2:70-1257(-)